MTTAETSLPAPRATGVHSLRLPILGLSLPSVLGLVALFVVPMGVFAVYSLLTAGIFTVSGPFTLASYRDALHSVTHDAPALNSLIVGLLAAAATVSLGLPIAFRIRYAQPRTQQVLFLLVTTTIFAGYLVRIYAWRSILGTHGVLNSALMGLGITDKPLGFLLYSRFAVVVALVHIYLPYVVLIIVAGFRPVSPALLEAAQDLGAGSVSRWRRVILPALASSVGTSFVLVFVLSASDYVTPQFLGGINGSMLGVGIQANFTSVGNWPLGAAISFVMLVGFVISYLATAFTLRVLRLNNLRFVT